MVPSSSPFLPPLKEKPQSRIVRVLITIVPCATVAGFLHPFEQV